MQPSQRAQLLHDDSAGAFERAVVKPVSTAPLAAPRRRPETPGPLSSLLCCCCLPGRRPSDPGEEEEPALSDTCSDGPTPRSTAAGQAPRGAFKQPPAPLACVNVAAAAGGGHHQQQTPWGSPQSTTGALRRLTTGQTEWHDALSSFGDASPPNLADLLGCSPPSPAAHQQQQQQLVMHHSGGAAHQPAHQAGPQHAAADAAVAADADAGGADAVAARRVDQLVRELGDFAAPWKPHPPLRWAPRPLAFVPPPANLGLHAFWERDDARTSPFPQPIDIAFKANFLVQKVHKSIPGMLIHETPDTLTVAATPSFMPPGIPVGYTEVYDKAHQSETHWNMRRDIKPGSSRGRIYLAEDGTLVLRVEQWSLGLWGKARLEVVTEDYMRLEEDGQLLVNQMHAYEVATGTYATQFLVGRRRQLPYHGHK